MFGLNIELDLASATNLHLYAVLSHQTMEQAAQQILNEFLGTIGETRCDHWLEKKLDEVDSVVNSASQEAVLKIS